MVDQHRRMFVESIVALSVVGSCCTKAFAQPMGTSTRISNGCFLTASGAESFRSGQIRLLATSGIPQADYAFTREVVQFMMPIFRLNPGSAFYDDSRSPNAFATPESLLGMPNGTIGFGVNLLRQLFANFSGRSTLSMGDHAATAIFAHEFGHIAQFVNAFPVSLGKIPELHADYMAGWYTGIRAVQLHGYQTLNFDEMAQQMFNIGDFEFTSQQHHGMPSERVSSFLAGAGLAINNRGQVDANSAFRAGMNYLGM